MLLPWMHIENTVGSRSASVTLTSPFYISTLEVSNKEFAMFEASHDSGSAVHASLAGDANPVANVTWQQAVAYCNFLSLREGLTPVYEERFGEFEAIRPFPNGYRLPTEAEWVWSMRFGANKSATKFSWGDQWPPRRDAGNFADRGRVLFGARAPSGVATGGRYDASRR